VKGKGLRALLALLILGVLLTRMDLPLLLSKAAQIRWEGVPLAILLGLAAFTTVSYRWYVLLRAVASFPVHFRDLWTITMVGVFAGYFLPGGFSIDVVRGIYLYRHAPARSQAFASLVVDRLLGLWVIMLLATLGTALTSDLRAWTLPLGILTLLAPLLAALLLSPPLARLLNRQIFRRSWGARWAEGYRALQVYVRKPGVLLHATVVSALFQTLYVSVAHVALWMVGNQGLVFPRTLAYVTLMNAVTMIPISVGGLGIREGGFVALFTPYAGREGAFLASLLYYLLSMSASLPGGVLWMTGKDRLRMKRPT
jgi:uncharacterized membrane protein YbhN (UPF0104 family)